MQIAKKQTIAKQEIMRQCQTCKGYGCKDCANKVERINIMANAGIPVRYWSYSLETFIGDEEYKRKLTQQINDIGKLYTEGTNIIFTGSIGVGKTFGACELLKSNLFNGMTGR